MPQALLQLRSHPSLSGERLSENLCKFVFPLFQTPFVVKNFNLSGQVGMQRMHISSPVGGCNIAKDATLIHLYIKSVCFLLLCTKKPLLHLQPRLRLQWVGSFAVQSGEVPKGGGMNRRSHFYQYT